MSSIDSCNFTDAMQHRMSSLIMFQDIENATQYLKALEGRSLSKFTVSAIIFSLLEKERAFNAPLHKVFDLKTCFSFLNFLLIFNIFNKIQDD